VWKRRQAIGKLEELSLLFSSPCIKEPTRFVFVSKELGLGVKTEGAAQVCFLKKRLTLSSGDINNRFGSSLKSDISFLTDGCLAFKIRGVNRSNLRSMFDSI